LTTERAAVRAAFRFVLASSVSVSSSPGGFPAGGFFAPLSSGGLPSLLSGGFAGGFPSSSSLPGGVSSPSGGVSSPACSSYPISIFVFSFRWDKSNVIT
jgi:hypothetical protein